MWLTVILRISLIYKNVIILFVSLALVNCGFALRSKVPFAPQLANTFIETGGKQSRVLSALRIALLQQDVSVPKNSKDSTATIKILNERCSRDVLTVSSSGKVQEFILSLQLDFSVENKLGVILVEPTQMQVERDLRFNPTSVAAGSSEEEQRIQDMIQDIVRKIILRLQHITL